MIIYFADRKMEILGAASTDLPKGLHITADKRTSDLETGTATFEVTVEYDDNQFSRKEAERYTEAPNYILRYNEALKAYEYYTIFTSDEDVNGKRIEIEAEDGGMDLLNETMDAVTYDTPKTCRELMEVPLNDTGFQIGQYDVDDSVKKSLDFNEETALSRLNSIASEFDVEIFFTFDVNAYAVTGKYLNVVKKRGNADPVDLRYGHEVSNIRISKSAEDIATGFRVRGSQESRDGFFVGLDSSGHKRYCWIKWADGYTEKKITSGSNKGQIEYSAPGMSDVPMNKGWIGIAYYKDTPEKSSKPEDYTWKQIGTQTGTTAETIKWDGWGIKVGSKYAWVRYADRRNGVGFSDSPVGKRYVCVALDKDTASKSNLWTDYMFFPFADTENASTLTLAGTQYDDGDIYYDNAHDLLLSRSGNSKWSRYVSGETGTASGYIIRNMSYTTSDQDDLLQKAVKDLQEMSQIKVTYEVDLIDFPEYLACGDYVNVLDESGDLYVKARIQKVEDSIIDGTKQLTLGDFKQLQSEISEQVQSLAEQFAKISDNMIRYTWIVYADDMSGTNMSVEPGSREYMGILTNQLVESPDLSNPDIYQWKKIVGEQGAQGMQGLQGEQGIQGPAGISSYVHIKYSSVANPSDSQMTETPDTYIGICTDSNESDPETASSYTWSKFEGSDGAQGIPGEKGSDGLTSYVHFAYSTSSDGKEDFSVTPFDGATYIGVCSDYHQNDPDTYSSYTWSKFKGEQGPRGLQGIQGDKGDQGIAGNGIQSVDIEYVSSGNAVETPTSGWQGDLPTVNQGEYLWTRTILTYTDGSKTTHYTISRQGIDGTNGTNGINGKDGTNGVNSYVHIKYAAVLSPTDSEMTETPSEYIGICTDQNLMDPETASSYTWSKFQGKDGAEGVKGKDGTDGKDAYVHFAYANSSDGSQDFSVTSFAGAKYIGVRSDNTKADSTVYTDYTWSLIKGADGKDGTSVTILGSYDTLADLQAAHPAGSAGDGYLIAGDLYVWQADSSSWKDVGQIKGEDGTDGKDGATAYAHFAYATSADGSQGFNTTWYAEATYIGVLSDHTQKDSETYTDYKWSLIKGKDGASSYTHVAYATSSDGSQGFSVSDSTNKTYIGICVDENETDPGTYSSYKWTLIKGQKGDQGIPGNDGQNGSTAYLHIAYANSADGQTDFTVDDSLSAGKLYIGQYTDHTQADSTTYSDYHWTKIKGEQGIQGIQGEQGIKGDAGNDGKTSYFHIKYAPVSSPSDSQLTETPDVYIGTYVDYTEADSTKASDYTWARFRGIQGEKGDQGIPGVGTDGKTSYLHIAYATSADGSQGFDVSESEGKTYIGQYVDFTETDSTTYSDYHWTKIKGEAGDTGPQGDPGKDGVSLQSFKTQYYLSSSETSVTGGSWSDSLPEYKSGYYYWYRTVQTYSNGTTKTTDAQLYGGQTQASKNALDASNKVSDLDTELDAEGLVKRLTNNGADEGLYYQNGHVYINASYILTGGLSSTNGRTKFDLDNGTIISRAGNSSGSRMVKISAGHIQVGYAYSTIENQNLQSNNTIDIYGNTIQISNGTYTTELGPNYAEVRDSSYNVLASMGNGGFSADAYYSADGSLGEAGTLISTSVSSTSTGAKWGRTAHICEYGMGDGGEIWIGPRGNYTYSSRGTGYGACDVYVKGHKFKSFTINGTSFLAFETATS